VTAEIIAIGSELLTPFRQDTNSLFLTAHLNRLGVEVMYKTVVGDDLKRLTDVARIALGRSEIVIFMGGLGPTEDDLTREAVSAALQLPLKRDPDLVANLYARFAKRKIKMTDNNLRQADLITGAASLSNPRGSAPGQWLEGSVEGANKIVILLPGPPVELKPLFEEQCLPRFQHTLPPSFLATRELRAAMSESECDALIAPIYKQYEDVVTTILAHPGEVQIHLLSKKKNFEEAQERVDALAEELEDALDDNLYSSRGESLEQIVGYFLDMRSATLAVAESCTGGLLGERITSVSGSSRWFLGGAIVYSNDLKTSLAEVPPLMIKEHGAVSKEVAAALAEGIRKRCKATFGVGVTGVAGPTGGSDDKPVGLVYVAVTDGRKTEVKHRNYPGDRERIRWWASQMALDMVRRRLM
jgi:competence/damage-inducible protein CinA-like protein